VLLLTGCGQVEQGEEGVRRDAERALDRAAKANDIDIRHTATRETAEGWYACGEVDGLAQGPHRFIYLAGRRKAVLLPARSGGDASVLEDGWDRICTGAK